MCNVDRYILSHVLALFLLQIAYNSVSDLKHCYQTVHGVH